VEDKKYIQDISQNTWNTGILGGSRRRFGDNIRIGVKETGYEVANFFQMRSTDCCKHTLIINLWVSYMVGIIFLLSERLIGFEEGFYPRDLVFSVNILTLFF
jgi:hypothetical protein